MQNINMNQTKRRKKIDWGAWLVRRFINKFAEHFDLEFASFEKWHL